MKKKYPLRRLYLDVKYFLILIFFLSISNIANAQSQKCSASLKVLDNENSKKAGESGVYYSLNLTNTGNQKTVFLISIDNNLTSNETSRFNNKGKKVKLNHELLNVSLKKIDKEESDSHKSTSKGNDRDNEENSIYKLNLASGESYNFYVKLELPPNTQIGSSNITTVTVTSNNCKDFILSQTFNTEIINGE